MTLRARLILWLLLLSVVPLGAVTTYAYISSADALRVAAAHEADLLAGELSSRMQLVTAELSDRVERLMTMPEPAPVVATASTVKPVTAKPGAKAGAAPALDAATAEQNAVNSQIANTLGDAAVLLNSVELQGMRGVFRGAGRSASRAGEAGSAGGTGTTPAGQHTRPNFRFTPEDPNRATAQRPRPSTEPGAAVPPTPGAPAAVPEPPARPAGAHVATPPEVAPVPPVAPGLAEDRFVVDVGAMARDLTRRLAPEGLDKLTPEERQRVTREIGMRMMGVTEGLRIGAAELKKRADAAKQKAAEDAKIVEAEHTSEPLAALPSQTKSTLTGNKLGVTVERGGQVVHRVNAEVNLDNLLMTVFSTTRRDQGEVPFAVAKDGKVYTQNAADRKTVEQFSSAVASPAPLGMSTVDDWIIVTNKDPSGSGLRFGIARPVGDSLSALRKTAGRNVGLGLLLIGLALVVVVPVSQGLTRNLSSLTAAVDRIALGDFNARVSVKGGGEVAALASAFNKMAADIQAQQELLVGQERLKRELELGRQIQSEMLPHESLRFGLTEVKGMSIPAREVGGDFFNYFAMGDGNIALLVGDVSGKGVGAALLMANFQAALRTRLTLGHDLASIADAIDRDVAATAPRGLYTTLFVGIYEPKTKRLRYVNAGHNPQFALRQGKIERLSSTGTPIGLLPGRGYTQQEIQLASGDFLFFYTDGIVETENELGEPFGGERLEHLLVETVTADPVGPDAVLERVESAVRAFQGAAEPFDDATTMVVRIG